MKRLVTPDLRLRLIADRTACDAYIKAAKLDKHAAGNLRQLLGFNELANDGRASKRIASTHQLFEDVTWVYHPDVTAAVPQAEPQLLAGAAWWPHAELAYQPGVR